MEKKNNSPIENARKSIETVLDAFSVDDALIIIGNGDEYQGMIFGNEKYIADNILIGMEQNNSVRVKMEKIIKLLTLKNN